MPTSKTHAVRPSSILASGFFANGLVDIFVGERLFGAGTGRTILSGLGVLFVLAAIVVRLYRAGRVAEVAKPVERRILLLTLVAAAAVALYFVQSDLAAPLFGGKSLAAGSPKLGSVLQALWPTVLLFASLPLLLVEIAYASMAAGSASAYPELGRIQDAALSGIGFAGAIVFAFTVAYVTAERDKKVDLSYFRTSRPGEATRKIVRTLDQPLEVSYFFAGGSDVGEEVASYFDDLKGESDKLVVKRLDQAVDPAKARELGVSGNGMVVIGRGTRREQLSVGTELEQARSQLKTLDKEVQKRLLSLSRPGRTAYLTTGHGERTSDPASDTDKRFTIRALRQLLLDQSWSVRELGAAEGLAADVPADAGVVMIIGPTKPFLTEELGALKRFSERGGRLFIALDPEAGLDEKELLAPLGLGYTPVQLANEQFFARRSYQPSDRINVVSSSFSSHPSVSTLAKAHAPAIFPGTGSLEELKDKPKGLTIDFTVHAMGGTWNDKNGNFEFDAKEEQKKGWELVAAVTRKKEVPAGGKANPAEDGRSLVLGDSDCLGDGVIGAVGNPYLVMDGLKWMMGDEAITGETSSEADVPIAHTKSQDAWWFYATVFLGPAVVLGVGFFATRRRKSRPRKDAGPRTNATTPDSSNDGSKEAA